MRPHGKIAGAEPDHRIIRVEGGHDNLSHLAIGHGIAGAGTDNFDNHAFIHNHAFASLAFISDHAKLGRCIALQDGDPAATEFLAK